MIKQHKPLSPLQSLFSWSWCILYFALCTWGVFAYCHIAATEPNYHELGQSFAAIAFALAYGLILLRFTISSRQSGNVLGPIQFFSSWVIFPVLRTIHHAFPISRDAWLKQIDSTLWGGQSLPAWALKLETPALSEILSFCYFTFYLICLFSAIYFILRPRPYDKRFGKPFFHGLMLMYLFGILGYITIPAAGPYAAFPAEFPYPVQGGLMTQFLTEIVEKGITGMDVFPSLHCGITLYILGFYWLAGYKKTALLIAPLFIGMTIATVYLRYHYGIDLIAGIILALLILCYVVPQIKEAKNAQ